MFDSTYTEIRPNVIYAPRLFLDGNQWCALYGENLQEGIAGFGNTPSDALADFNNSFLVPAPKMVKK